jgi:hypothetical protein
MIYVCLSLCIYIYIYIYIYMYTCVDVYALLAFGRVVKHLCIDWRHKIMYPPAKWGGERLPGATSKTDLIWFETRMVVFMRKSRCCLPQVWHMTLPNSSAKEDHVFKLESSAHVRIVDLEYTVVWTKMSYEGMYMVYCWVNAFKLRGLVERWLTCILSVWHVSMAYKHECLPRGLQHEHGNHFSWSPCRWWILAKNFRCHTESLSLNTCGPFHKSVYEQIHFCTACSHPTGVLILAITIVVCHASMSRVVYFRRKLWPMGCAHAFVIFGRLWFWFRIS